MVTIKFEQRLEFSKSCITFDNYDVNKLEKSQINSCRASLIFKYPVRRYNLIQEKLRNHDTIISKIKLNLRNNKNIFIWIIKFVIPGIKKIEISLKEVCQVFEIESRNYLKFMIIICVWFMENFIQIKLELSKGVFCGIFSNLSSWILNAHITNER